MEPIPNWFRGLIIVIATLIMCACRTPLQQSPTQSVLKRKPAEPIISPDQSVVTTLKKLHNSYDVDMDFLSSTVPPEPIAAPAPNLVANPPVPVIQLPGKSMGRQDITQLADAQPVHQSPVYFHIDDELFAVKPAQAITPATESTSPFLDDPELPVGPSPLTPILDPSFAEQLPAENPPMVSPPAETRQMIQQAVPAHPVQRYPDQQIILGPISTPIIGEFDSVPLAPGITMEACPSLPAPFDYLPQAEIPIEVSPEHWATLPCESMEASYGELSQHYPDEYICDGGDALGEVKVLPDWSLKHLDPEDTVGHYDTLDRTVEVAASNRVCIYAPRFAAVRKVTSPFENEKLEQVLAEKRGDVAVTQNQDLATVSYDQSVAAQRHIKLQPPSTMQRDVPSITGIHKLPVRVINADFSVHEDFRVMKLGIHKQAEKPRLAEFTAKAITWSHDKAVQVVVDDVIAHSNLTYRSVESIHRIGDDRPAKLRVIKTASVSDALPGEEVEFTLRFDNIGYQPMGNVTIIDNLTTRLEYLQDTELCSLENNFVVDENEVDSLTLRWEIKDPIMPGKGGLIRFKCRVR